MSSNVGFYNMLVILYRFDSSFDEVIHTKKSARLGPNPRFVHTYVMTTRFSYLEKLRYIPTFKVPKINLFLFLFLFKDLSSMLYESLKSLLPLAECFTEYSRDAVIKKNKILLTNMFVILRRGLHPMP